MNWDGEEPAVNDGAEFEKKSGGEICRVPISLKASMQTDRCRR